VNIINREVDKLVKNYFKKLYDSTEEYWKFLNIDHKDKKINNACSEIKEIMVISPLAFFIVTFIAIYGRIINLTFVDGSGLIFVFGTFIYIIWAFAILHTNKNHKHQIRQCQEENYQPMHD